MTGLLNWIIPLLMFLMFCMSGLMILLVLVQRGKGGGLVGALGGAGGSSALGTKATDSLTKFTLVFAVAWIFVCALTIIAVKNASPVAIGGGPGEEAVDPGAPTLRDLEDEEEEQEGGLSGTENKEEE